MAIHWIQRDSKSPQVSRTFSILSDLNNAVVCIVSTRPLISISSSPCTNPLVAQSAGGVEYTNCFSTEG